MEYCFEQNGESRGPFTVEEIGRLNLSPETLVWNESMSDWLPMKAVPELMDSTRKFGNPYVYTDHTPINKTATVFAGFGCAITFLFSFSGGGGLTIFIIYVVALAVALYGMYINKLADAEMKRNDMKRAESMSKKVFKFSIVSIALSVLNTVSIFVILANWSKFS